MSVFWNEIQRVAKGCLEGRQMVSTSRGGSRVFHADWHDTERRIAVERREKAAAALSTVGISKRLGGAGGGVGEKGGRQAQETEVWVWPSSSLNLWAFQWP